MGRWTNLSVLMIVSNPPWNIPHGNSVQADMPRLWLLASTVLASIYPAVAAEPGAWGPTVDGVKMAVVVNRNAAEAELQITVKNVSNEPMLLPLGHIRNQRTTVLWFRVFVTTRDGTERTVVSGPAKIGGSFSITPVTIELLPNASYTTGNALTGMEDLNIPTNLKALLPDAAQLRVELDTTQIECPDTCVPGIVIPCWHGKIVSNVLQLPE